MDDLTCSDGPPRYSFTNARQEVDDVRLAEGQAVNQRWLQFRNVVDTQQSHAGGHFLFKN
jgi:hypothetical protein